MFFNVFFKKKSCDSCQRVASLRQAFDVKVYDIAWHLPLGLPAGERRQLLRQLHSADSEKAEHAALVLEGVYAQLLLAVAGRYQECARLAGLSLDDLVAASRAGVVQEMREPTCLPGERLASRVVRAAKDAIIRLLWEKCYGYCAN